MDIVAKDVDTFGIEYNATNRLGLLKQVIQILRDSFGDDLMLVVAPGGFFGYRGAVPNVITSEIVETTAGRVIFNDIVPKGIPFSLVNRDLGKKALGQLIDKCYRACGQKHCTFRRCSVGIRIRPVDNRWNFYLYR